jgi:acetolactate synthase-1/2/3 large subunit
MNVDTTICRILKAEGIDWIAAFPHQSIIDVAAKEGIKPVIVRQERAGVNMADALSRVTNGKTIGVFTMQYGPGAENAFSGVAQAYADSVPILLLPGGNPQDRVGVHPNFDSLDHYKGITKWASSINSADRTVDVMRSAFSNLRNGRPGPVLVEIPIDVATQEVTNYNYTPVKQNRSAADPQDVSDLVDAIVRSTQPVITAGQGVMYSDATSELIELSELTGIPVVTTLAGKSGFPENHPLSLGCAARTATGMSAHFLNETDLIIGIGTSFTKSVFGFPVPDQAQIIQITNHAEDIHKDYSINYGAVGDAKLVIKQMIEELKNRKFQPREGVSNLMDQQRTLWMNQWEPKLSSSEIPINPYRVFREIEKTVDVSNTIVTHDSGYPRDQLVPFWKPVTQHGYIGWGKSTQLGYGLGLAIGAKLAQPEKTVINFMGDAAFGMSGLDIETATRNKIGITTVVLRNGVMTGYAANYMPVAADTYGSNQLEGDYAAVAKGLGAHGERIDKIEDISSGMNRALAANKKGQPALLEIITKEEPEVSKYW